MAQEVDKVETNNLIRYSKLKEELFNAISPSLANVPKFASNVPDLIKNSSVVTLATKAVRNRTGGSWSASYSDLTLTAKANVKDPVLVEVPIRTMQEQFDAFFASRGLLNTSNELLSFKGVLNFYANAAAFFSSRLVTVNSPFDSRVFLFYNSRPVDYPAVSNVYPGTEPYQFTKTEVTNGLRELLGAINNKSTTHTAQTLVEFISSSSSSSSSSSCSCSSSSCSSSSSCYIAYMDI